MHKEIFLHLVKTENLKNFSPNYTFCQKYNSYMQQVQDGNTYGLILYLWEVFQMEKNRVFCSILAVLLSAAVMAGTGFTSAGSYVGTSVSVSAAETLAFGDFEYEVNDNGDIEITKYIGSGGDVVIPDIIDGKNVVSIGKRAFVGSWNLRSITIPDSVTEINSMAFYGCAGLKSVVIGNGVTEIGERVFENCTSLTEVAMPDSVTEIGWHSFCGCTSLKSITIPDSVSNIGYRAFCDCTSLENITIPKSVAYINGSAFKNCTSLKSIVIPDSVTEIGWGVFSGCSSLASVTIGSNLEEIGWYEFDNCTSLTSVVIPDNVKEIGWLAFRGCTKLTSIVIPESVTLMGVDVFADCQNLTIYGTKDSEAEEYANKNNIPFISDISAKEIVIGKTVTVNAKAVLGDGNHTYAVLYKKKADTKWTVKQNYSTNDTVTIKPAKATDYDICIKVKDSNGKIVKKFIELKVNTQLENTSTISASEIERGSTVVVNGSATGGVGSYAYAVYYKQKTQTKWTVRQSYKDNSEIIVRPYTNTDYDICIKVKDKNGTVAKKYFTVTVR